MAVRDLLDEVVAWREEQRRETAAVREELGMLRGTVAGLSGSGLDAVADAPRAARGARDEVVAAVGGWGAGAAEGAAARGSDWGLAWSGMHMLATARA